MPRIARVIEVDYPHHVVQRGNNRQRIFFEDDDMETYMNLFKKYTKECHCKVNAYCLMPNHIHMLMVPLEKESLSTNMQKLSLTYTQYINRRYKERGGSGNADSILL